jgi:DNA-binding IclR family transcriptional regulator
MNDPRAGVRFAAVLTALAESQGFCALSQIAQRVGLPHSTVHRILEQMVELGLAQQGPGRLYGVGMEFSRIGALAAMQLDIAAQARPILERITAYCNETSLLGVFHPATGSMAFAFKVDAKYPLKYKAQLHVHRTLVWGATGHAILAWLPPSRIDDILEHASSSPAQPALCLRREDLLRKLDRTRERGYAVSHGERTMGAVGIAAPVFKEGGEVVGDLCLTIPEFRYDASLEDQLGRLLVAGAAELSRKLGAVQVPTLARTTSNLQLVK